MTVAKLQDAIKPFFEDGVVSMHFITAHLGYPLDWRDKVKNKVATRLIAKAKKNNTAWDWLCQERITKGH